MKSKITKRAYTKAGVEVDEATWHEFRALVESRGYKIKHALTLAVRAWILAQKDVK